MINDSGLPGEDPRCASRNASLGRCVAVSDLVSEVGGMVCRIALQRGGSSSSEDGGVGAKFI